MLTSTEIVKAATSSRSGVDAGSIAFLAHREKGKETVKQSAFLKDAQQIHPVGVAPTAEIYQHPGRTPKDQRRGGGPLTPVEVAWMQRLPADPSKTSFDDACAVGQLSADISKMENPADARLVASYWTPIKDFHDGNAANVTLANARATPTSTPPSSALPALAEAVTAEHPELSHGESAGRAKAMLDEATAKRSDVRAQAISDAQDTLSSLAGTARARSATTR